MKKSQLRELIREVINETLYAFPNDEEGDIRGDAERTGEDFIGRAEARKIWYDSGMPTSTTIGTYVAALKKRGIPDDDALKLAFAWDNIFQEEYDAKRQSRYGKRRF